jgi:hypothetical protein
VNRLDSDLKRLMAWAGRALPRQPEEAPFGFAGRVVAAWKPAQAPTLFLELQRIALVCACVSVAVALCGVLVLASQAHAPEPADAFSSALRFLASSLAQ